MSDGVELLDNAEQALVLRLQMRIDLRQLQLPLLPRVVAQVLNLINDQTSDSRKLAALVRTDPSLAGNVLRVANSAAYSFAFPVTSLQQALTRLGMRGVGEIAMAAAMGPQLFIAPGFEHVVQSLWRDSLATALWAREMALGANYAELAFLCGLLHQIGKPAILHEALSNHDGLLDEGMVVRLMERFGTVVGIELATHWQLPDAVVATIAALGQIEFYSGFPVLVRCVRAARALAARTRNAEVLGIEEMQELADSAGFEVDPKVIARWQGKQAQIASMTTVLAL